jgi:glutamine---fructose-6-phosphate transaminase (isomerizing)
MDSSKLQKKFPGGILRIGHPYYMADAIGDIPGCLSACLADEMITRISRSIGDFQPVRIFTLGCGTSYNAGQAAAYTLQTLLGIPVSAHDAFDFELDMPPGVDHQAMVIGISESGQSITTCLSIEKARELGAFTVGISANPESRLAKSAHLSLVDPYLHEIPFGKTRTYLSTALLAMLAGILSRKDVSHTDFIDHVKKQITAICDHSASWQSAARDIAAKARKGQTRYMVTGFGAQKANADEIRLKLLEILGESATSFGLEEFTHGPSACFDEDLTVIMLQTDERTLAKAVRIAQGIVHSEASLVVITDRVDAGWPEQASLIETGAAKNTPSLYSQFSAMVAAQYLFYNLALTKGLNPDVNLEDRHPELGDIYAFFFPPGTH